MRCLPFFRVGLFRERGTAVGKGGHFAVDFVGESCGFLGEVLFGQGGWFFGRFHGGDERGL